MAGIILVAVVKLLWGMALWARKSDHRVGDRWGDEPVEVVEWSGRDGYVNAGGELWRAAGPRVAARRARPRREDEGPPARGQTNRKRRRTAPHKEMTNARRP